jgi:RHS repeat-associated protein
VSGAGKDAVVRYHWDRKWDFADSSISATGLVSTFQYDASTGNRLWQQPGPNPAHRVNFGYTSFGQLSQTTLPGSYPDQLFYSDVLRNTSTYLTPNGYYTSYFQDRIGRDTTVQKQIDLTFALYTETRTKYNQAGLDSMTQTVAPEMNGAPRESVTVIQLYDAEGNRLSLSRKAEPTVSGIGTLVTSWAYDSLGRVVKETAPDGKSDSTGYDLSGNITKAWTRRARGDHPGTPDYVLTREYDDLNRLTRRITPAVTYSTRNLGIPLYRPELNGTSGGENPPYPRYPLNSTSGTNVIAADTAVFTYNSIGSITSADNSDALIRRSYFPNGQLAAETTYVRKTQGSMDATHKYVVSSRYDLDGNRVKLIHPTQLAPVLGGVVKDTTRFEYDPARGQLASVVDPLGQTFTYAYNARGELEWLYMPRDRRDNYVYDIDGDLTDHNTYATGPALRATHISYDARGKMYQSKNSFGAKDTLTVLYSGLGNVVQNTQIAHGENWFNAPGTWITGESFTVDALGNAKWVTSNQSKKFPKSSYTGSTPREQLYEASTGRLVLAKQSTYQKDTTAYDLDGNVIFTWQAENITQGSYKTQLHDRASYYDAAGQLRVADAREAPLGGLGEYTLVTVFEEYRYDALGRRVFVRSRRTCNYQPPDLDSGGRDECNISFVRRTVWDGMAEFYEIQMPGENGSPDLESDGSHTPRSRMSQEVDPNPFFGRVAYTYGLGLDKPLSVTRMAYGAFNAGATYPSYVTRSPFTIVPLWNTRGEPDMGYIAQSDTLLCAAKDSVNCVMLDWPRAWSVYGVGDRTPLYFHGSLLFDKRDKAGTVYRRNRYYDPATGRFTQEDPIGLAGGLNLYGFANGDAVNYGDPFGLFGCKRWVALAQLCFAVARVFSEGGLVHPAELGKVGEAAAEMATGDGSESTRLAEEVDETPKASGPDPKLRNARGKPNYANPKAYKSQRMGQMRNTFLRSGGIMMALDIFGYWGTVQMYQEMEKQRKDNLAKGCWFVGEAEGRLYCVPDAE